MIGRQKDVGGTTKSTLRFNEKRLRKEFKESQEFKEYEHLLELQSVVGCGSFAMTEIFIGYPSP